MQRRRKVSRGEVVNGRVSGIGQESFEGIAPVMECVRVRTSYPTANLLADYIEDDSNTCAHRERLWFFEALYSQWATMAHLDRKACFFQMCSCLLAIT